MGQHQNNHSKDEHEHSGDDRSHHDHHKMMIEDFKKRFWISLVIMLPIVVLAPMIQDLVGYEFRFKWDRYLQFGLSSFVFFYGGWPFLKGLVDEIKEKTPGMMTLIALAISVAYFYSSAVVFGLEGKIFFWELASLIVIMLLGHWIEMKSVMGASNALEELAKMMPSTARRIKEDGEHEEVSIDDLKNEDVILVKPGEKIPADGQVIEGESHVNESMLTGESKPVAKHEEDEVIGGSINDNGSLKIKVQHTGKDSYLSKVIGMVEEAQKTKSKTQNLANKAAAWLFYVALGAGIITLIVWLSLGKEFEYALERTVTVMIISCPHALGLAVPLVVAISTAVSAKNGLLIRNRTAFENSRKISAIIFDKTGTLTQGKFGVTRYKSVLENQSDDELLQIAASLENSSEHPIASGIVRKAKSQNLDLQEASSFQNITGKGIQATLNDQEIKIVSPGMLKEQDIEIPSEAFKSKDETVVFVTIDAKLAGFIALADEIRPESLSAIKTLKDRGIKVIMATGDNEQVAKAVSEELSLDDYYAEVLPEDKQSIIKDLQEKGEFVAMTGDGVNDAPALAQADVGIAVGSGTDVAAETADIILVNSNPKDIANLILFGTATYKKMMQNLWWAAGYNIIAVPLAAGVLAGVGIILSPALGAVLMSLSTVIVAVNAQLLKKQMK
ncbi:copper-translocating P-type ATPase [Psychroflexus sp. YR1-1]|uniref:Copper-translocating P-type ATPase n=1 Tax=Psychroflexus aurantiacus TaxID=2709310 RepID=A0A6B3R1H3_9FLAO|nr:copper-translocating P-type ATPase [Psychroflexus aurantiacus]NEV94443.1 copper-translocating P-type ATPase [Psychroflexus aurantiacus]